MAMGVGLRPNAKALESPPNPTVRSASVLPDRGSTKGNATRNLTRAGLSAGKARHRFVGRTKRDGAVTPRGRRSSLPKVRAV